MDYNWSFTNTFEKGRKIMSKKTLSSILFAVAISLCLSGMAIAQEITGNIVGTVRDANGAAVAGAIVTITDPSKGGIVIRSATTNDNGEYSAPNLPISTYSVTVEAPNFKKSVSTDVKVDVGQRRAVDVTLAAGKIDETVTVTADAVAIDLQSATSGTIINGDQAREIPINNRNFVQLVALAPGVTNDLADQVYVGTTNPDGQANIVSISVNGGRSSQNTWTVDGADITDRGSNITIQAYPSVDSIGEFRVLRSLYPAEAGRSGGGQINIVTRSGKSRFHGSAFEFVRNEGFNANSFLNNAVITPQFGRKCADGSIPLTNDPTCKARRPPFKYHNYGFTFSGPIYFLNFGEHDSDDSYFTRYKKTFFFFSEEKRRDRRYSSAATTTVPDAFLRVGRFPIPVCIRPLPAAGACPASSILPANTPINPALINPVALAYLNGVYNKLPLPNASTNANPFALSASLGGVADFRQEILKIDHSFSDKWSMYYRFGNDKIPTIDANALFSSGSGLPGVSTTSTNSPGKTHTFQTTYVVTPNIIVEGRYTYAYGAILSENIGTLALANTQVPLTLPFINEKDRIPSLSGNGFTALGSFGPYDNFSNKKNANASLTWIMGGHTMKFGVAHSLYRKNENALAGVNEGNFSAFDATLAPGQPALPAPYTTPSGTVFPTAVTTALSQNMQRWANFLVGNVATFTQAHYDATADLRQTTFEAYAQDEWRFRSNLTLYYGVRYSYFPSPWDKNGRLSNFVPSLWSAAAAPQVTGAGNRISGVAGVNTGNWCNGVIVNSQNVQTGPAVFNCTPTASPWGKYVINVPKKDFAPRVGLAWDPFGKGTTAIRMGYGIYHEQVLVGTFLQNIGLNPPYQETLTASQTNLSNPAGSVLASALVQGLRAVDSDWNTPYMQHWSFDVQRQLTSKTVVTIGYYGSKGVHLIGLTEMNSLPPGKALSSQCAVGGAYYGQTPAPTLVQCQPNGYTFRNTAVTGAAVGNPNGTAGDVLILDQIRPFKGFRSIAMVQPRYNSNYHSMQISGQHRFSGASQVNLAYTFGRNLTDSQNDRTASPVNAFNIPAEYARAALDRRHVLSINYVYELPFFTKQQGFVGKVLGGWQASGIVTYNTGLPFTATTSNYDPAGLGIINTNPAARPNQICDPNVNAPHTRLNWVNIACFELNPSNAAVGLPNTVGNASRGTINGPPTTRVDFTMSKNIRFGETMSVQLRGEVFNILNHTNFRGLASTNVTSAAFGQVSTVRDPRTMQFGAKFTF
jgi:hypothetical protein